jgi:hypothetical protein
MFTATGFRAGMVSITLNKEEGNHMQLAKSAMLVSASIVNGGLLGERRDDKASILIEDTYNVAQRRTKASKFLIDRKHKSVKQVVASSQRVREVVYRYTMPWGDDKTRLLPVKLMDTFKVKIDLAIAELQEARENYIQNYPALVAASERDLGELFDRSQYPGSDKIRDLFKTKVTYWPVPESGHFIAEITEGAAEAARDNIKREIEERLIEATYDIVRRAKEVVSTYVEKLENYKPVKMVDDGFGFKTKEPGNGTAFRDSLVQNVRDTANLIESMNLTNNPQIFKAVKDLKRLSGFAAYDLRKTPSIREKALSTGQGILINLTMLDLKDQEVADMVADTSDYMD